MRTRPSPNTLITTECSNLTQLVDFFGILKLEDRLLGSVFEYSTDPNIEWPK